MSSISSYYYFSFESLTFLLCVVKNSFDIIRKNKEKKLYLYNLKKRDILKRLILNNKKEIYLI